MQDSQAKNSRQVNTLGTPGASASNKYRKDSADESELDSEALAIQGMTMRERICQIFTRMHQSMIRLAEQYDAERRKVVYITPTAFTQLFALFQEFLTRKNEVVELERSKYEQGVKKLEEAGVLIVEMNYTLEKLEPMLVQKRK